LVDGLQSVEDLMANLAAMLIVGMEAKASETTVGHVKEDLENTPQPPTWGAKCR
jgi:hypothetical protein